MYTKSFYFLPQFIKLIHIYTYEDIFPSQVID